MNSKYENGVSGFLFERKVKFVSAIKPAGENTQAGARGVKHQQTKKKNLLVKTPGRGGSGKTPTNYKK